MPPYLAGQKNNPTTLGNPGCILWAYPHWTTTEWGTQAWQPSSITFPKPMFIQ